LWPKQTEEAAVSLNDSTRLGGGGGWHYTETTPATAILKFSTNTLTFNIFPGNLTHLIDI
jgi:hypothetical protein